MPKILFRLIFYSCTSLYCQFPNPNLFFHLDIYAFITFYYLKLNINQLTLIIFYPETSPLPIMVGFSGCIVIPIDHLNLKKKKDSYICFSLFLPWSITSTPINSYLYWFPIAVVTYYYKLSGLKQLKTAINLLSYSFRGQKSEMG